MSFANRCAVAVTAGCGIVCAAFGTMALAGWQTGTLRLASAFIPGPPTGLLTAATMLLTGIGLFASALGRPRLAVPGGLFALTAGTAVLVSRLLDPDGVAVESALRQALPRLPAIEPIGVMLAEKRQLCIGVVIVDDDRRRKLAQQ